MPLYFFGTDNGTDRIIDNTGTELADDQAARDEATVALGELARDYIPHQTEAQKNITMWVRNEAKDSILVLTLNFALLPASEALKVSPPSSRL